MPQSLSSVHLHAVFSTRNRRPWLDGDGFRTGVYAYISEVSNRLGCPVVAIGGIEDHMHLLARFARTLSIADWMKEIKRVSSTFIKQSQPEFFWQGVYGVFGVDSTSLDRVIAYIRNQAEHHRKISFQDEFRQLMREHDLEWDERYVWE